MFKQNAFLNFVSTLFGCSLQLTPVKNFPPVSTTPVVNLLPASRTPAVHALSCEYFREFKKNEITLMDLLVAGRELIHEKT
jgi:hypothetical protein